MYAGGNLSGLGALSCVEDYSKILILKLELCFS